MKPLPLKHDNNHIIFFKEHWSNSINALFSFLFTPVFYGVLLLVLTVSCKNEKADIERVTIDDSYPHEVSENVTLYYSDSAKLKVKLKAPLLENYYRGEDSYSEFRKGIDVEFYNDSGRVTSTITSNYAKYYSERGVMVAEDDVEVVNEEGEILNTEHLIWNQDKEEITSEAFVKITTSEEIIYGNGLVSNENFTKYRIKDIKGIINVSDKDDEEIKKEEEQIDEELQ